MNRKGQSYCRCMLYSPKKFTKRRYALGLQWILVDRSLNFWIFTECQNVLKFSCILIGSNYGVNMFSGKSKLVNRDLKSSKNWLVYWSISFL